MLNRLKKCFNRVSNAVFRVPTKLAEKTDDFLTRASKAKGLKRRAYKAFAGVTGVGMMASAIPCAALIAGGNVIDAAKRKFGRGPGKHH